MELLALGHQGQPDMSGDFWGFKRGVYQSVLSPFDNRVGWRDLLLLARRVEGAARDHATMWPLYIRLFHKILEGVAATRAFF